MTRETEMEFIDRIGEYIDLDEIDDRIDLFNKLRRKSTAKTSKGFSKQMDVLAKHLGIERTKLTEKRGKPTYHTVKNKQVVVQRYYKEDKVFDVAVVKPTGFKKRQIRDIKTGKIIGWE